LINGSNSLTNPFGPMPGLDWQWYAIVVGKTGGWLPEGRDPWLKESNATRRRWTRRGSRTL